MSLDNPNRIEKLISWWKSYSHKDVVMYCILALILFAGTLWAISVFSSKWQDRQIRKEKEKVEQTIGEIRTKEAELQKLNEELAEKRGELKKDVEALNNATFGREEAKKATNEALSNYNKVVNSGANTNATLNDLTNTLEKLK